MADKAANDRQSSESDKLSPVVVTQSLKWRWVIVV